MLNIISHFCVYWARLSKTKSNSGTYLLSRVSIFMPIDRRQFRVDEVLQIILIHQKHKIKFLILFSGNFFLRAIYFRERRKNKSNSRINRFTLEWFRSTCHTDTFSSYKGRERTQRKTRIYLLHHYREEVLSSTFAIHAPFLWFN